MTGQEIADKPVKDFFEPLASEIFGTWNGVIRNASHAIKILDMAELAEKELRITPTEADDKVRQQAIEVLKRATQQK